MPLRRHVKQLVLYDDAIPLVCEVCNGAMTAGNAISMFVEYPMPGVSHGQRCSVVQHFYCCHKHAQIGTIVCAIFHLQDDVPHSNTGPINPVPQESIIDQLRNELAGYSG